MLGRNLAVKRLKKTGDGLLNPPPAFSPKIGL